jgi:ribulose-5-phosphate 4-epimerase/fuculose-1-phosphate aldolase
MDSSTARTDLVEANHVLVHKGVLDAYGHVSMRDPDDASRFLLSRNLAPGLVGPGDILCYERDAVTYDTRAGYLERFIHSEIYRSRPDVMAVVHSHSLSIVPFSIVNRPLRAVTHMAGFLGTAVPVFEIRDHAGDGSDLLISNAQLGQALANTLSGGPTLLMRGHGSVSVGGSLAQAVHRAVFAELNARTQAASLGLGEPNYLTDAECVAAARSNDGQIDRAWKVWRLEARAVELKG